MVVYKYNTHIENKGTFSLSFAYHIKIILEKTFFSACLLYSLFILVYLKHNKDIENKIADNIKLITAPYFKVFVGYNYIINEINNVITYHTNVVNTNKYLLNRNLELQLQLINLKVLEDENKELKNILHLISTNNITNYTIKKIDTITNNSFTNRIHISKNKDDKIIENDIVIDNKGNLVGKVINVTDNNAEILLLSDTHFRISAILGKSMIKIILSGNENKKMKIHYFLNEQFNINSNENVYTSNDSNIVPNGIYIGQIIKNGQKYFVETATDLSKIDYVIILHNK